MTDAFKTELPSADALAAEKPAAEKPAADKPAAEARIFSPNTRFGAMARRPGGVPRERALERAAALIEVAKVGFDDWLESELRSLIALIASVRTGEAPADWIDAAQFRCSQLRDVGGMIGFELLSFVAGTLCTILDRIKAGAECNLESIACHIDALLLIRHEKYRNLRPDQVPELSQGLFRVAEHVSIVPGGESNE